MNDIAAVIRLCYAPDADEANRRWRFAFFRDHVLPRIQAQTMPVDTWVWVHPRHVDEARAIPGVSVFTVDLDDPGSIAFDNTILRGFPWRAVQGLPRYPYQVLMGSDDLIGPRYMAASLDVLGYLRQPRALVTHQPIALHWGTQRLYRMPAHRRPSPFVVLRQPDDERYSWVWARDHRHLGQEVDATRRIPEGHAVMVLHDYNDGTTLTAAFTEIPRAALRWL